MHGLGAFLVVSALVIVTPGQDTALTIRNSLLAGRRGGVASALGVVTGQLMWGLATSAGLSAVIVASEPVFRALRWIGAAYLVYLGLRVLRGARTAAVAIPPARRPYRQGVISNLGNPKIAVFFTSLLPQFGTSFPTLVLLSVIFASLTLIWLSLYALAVAKAGDLLRHGRIRRALDAFMGMVLVALGLRLATER